MTLAYALYFLVAFNCLRLLMTDVIFTGQMGAYVRGLMLAQAAGQAFILISLAFAFLMHAPLRFKRGIEWFLAGLCILSVGATLWQYDLSPELRMGLVGNVGMNASLILCLSPMLLAKTKPIWLKDILCLNILLAAYLTHEYTALLLCLAIPALWFVRVKGIPWKLLTWLTLALGVLVVTGEAKQLVLGHFTETVAPIMPHWEPRWRIAKVAWKTYWDAPSLFWGYGPGSASAILPYFQIKLGALSTIRGTETGVFTQVHNDWLQLLFELGWGGALLGCIFWGYVLKRAWSQPAVWISLMGFSLVGLFYFPLHEAADFRGTEIALTCLVWLAFKGQPSHARGQRSPYQ